MAYTTIDFPTKKALKQAVASYVGWDKAGRPSGSEQEPVTCYQPGLGPDLSTFSGSVTLEGPHAPKPHTWYAQATLVNGVVVSVR